MSLLAKHQDREEPEVIGTYTMNDSPPDIAPITPRNYRIKNGSVIISDKIWQGEAPHRAIKSCIYMLIIVVTFILIAQSGLIYVHGFSVKTGFIEKYAPLFYLLVANYIVFLPLTKILTNIRYFVFDEDKATLHCKKFGELKFDSKDIKFHLIKCSWPRDLYYLEIEIPTPLLQGYHRMMLIEMAARQETLEGNLAALLPLLRGDDEPFKRARKRRYVPIPAEEKPSLWKRNVNWDSHKIVWFNCYIINHILFWLVHGNRKFKNAVSKTME